MRSPWPLFATVLVLGNVSCCSGSRRAHDGGGGGGPDGDARADAVADGDADREGGADTDGDSPSPQDVPQCGDGVVDDGEDCDDRNRLDGDGCTWECRIGPGDPRPPVTPGTSPYEPNDPGGEMPDLVPAAPMPEFQLPVVWNGEVLATAFAEEAGDGLLAVRFRRFDVSGSRIGEDWVSEPMGLYGAQIDLAWSGESYALVYNDADLGVLLVLLDATGKPLGEPALVAAEPRARAPSIDVAAPGFVVAWVREEGSAPGPSWCTGGSSPDTLWLRLVGPDGATEGLPGPLLLDDHAGGPPRVASGELGVGIASYVDGSGVAPDCASRFIWVGADLGEVVYSGILSNGAGADVTYADGRYRVAWPHWEDTVEGFEGELCVATFPDGGVLEGAPVCNGPYASGTGPSFDCAYLATGDEGLGVVAGGGGSRGLYFLRADLRGTSVGAPVAVPGATVYLGGYGIAWAATGFAVVFAEIVPSPLRVQMLVPAP